MVLHILSCYTSRPSDCFRRYWSKVVSEPLSVTREPDSLFLETCCSLFPFKCSGGTLEGYDL
jgi:hypothetical protein